MTEFGARHPGSWRDQQNLTTSYRWTIATRKRLHKPARAGRGVYYPHLETIWPGLHFDAWTTYSMMVMEHEHPVEHHAAEVGRQGVKREWSVLKGTRPADRCSVYRAGGLYQAGFDHVGDVVGHDRRHRARGQGDVGSVIDAVCADDMQSGDSIHHGPGPEGQDRAAGVKITGHAVTLGMAATRQAANDFIRANPPRAAEIYLALAGGKKPAPA